MNRKINGLGISLIKEFEGCVLTAYLCPIKVPTIGYGHTEDVKMGSVITQQEADRLLKEDLKIYETAVCKALSRSVSDNKFAALVIFTFNVGVSAFQDSTLLLKLNGGDFPGAANEFLRWSKAGDRVLPGLTRRRQAERKLFLKPDEKYD